MEVVRVAEPLHAHVPSQAGLGDVPAGARAVGAEEGGGHDADAAGLEAMVAEVDDEVGEVLDGVADREVVEVEDAEAVPVDDQLLQEEVSVDEPVGGGRQLKRGLLEPCDDFLEPCAQPGIGLRQLARFRRGGGEPVGEGGPGQIGQPQRVEPREAEGRALEEVLAAPFDRAGEWRPGELRLPNGPGRRAVAERRGDDEGVLRFRELAGERLDPPGDDARPVVLEGLPVQRDRAQPVARDATDLGLVADDVDRDVGVGPGGEAVIRQVPPEFLPDDDLGQVEHLRIVGKGPDDEVELREMRHRRAERWRDRRRRARLGELLTAPAVTIGLDVEEVTLASRPAVDRELVAHREEGLPAPSVLRRRPVAGMDDLAVVDHDARRPQAR